MSRWCPLLKVTAKQRVASFFHCHGRGPIRTIVGRTDFNSEDDLGFFDKIFGRKPRDRRVTARLRVTIGQSDSAYWTEDVAIGGIRMGIGQQLALGDLNGGSCDVLLSIDLEPNTDPARLYGGQLSTGWMFRATKGTAKSACRPLSIPPTRAQIWSVQGLPNRRPFSF